MGKIITCIDGSIYSDSVCILSAWAAKKTSLPISLLHMVTPHCEVAAKSDLTGQIGLGAKGNLLKELTKLDEAHGKLEQKKGQLMLDHAKEILLEEGLNQPEILHRRGSLVDTITEMEAEEELIVMGKRGEHHHIAHNHLGSNLERVARAIHKPLLVAPQNIKPINRFLIAYDGSPSSQIAVEYAIANPLLKGLECFLIKIVNGDTSKAESILKQAEDKLINAGFTTHSSIKHGNIVALVADYIKKNAIDLLVIGAYGHSKIRCLILGSTTTALIRKSNVPVLLFR